MWQKSLEFVIKASFIVKTMSKVTSTPTNLLEKDFLTA